MYRPYRAVQVEIVNLGQDSLYDGRSSDNLDRIDQLSLFYFDQYGRFLKHQKYDVCYVRNFTDVDDKVKVESFPRYQYADCSLLVGTTKIGHRRSISAVGGQVRPSRWLIEGERRRGRYLLFPGSPRNLSPANDSSSAGFLPPAQGDKARKEKGEQGDALYPRGGRRRCLVSPRGDKGERGNALSLCAGMRRRLVSPCGNEATPHLLTRVEGRTRRRLISPYRDKLGMLVRTGKANLD
ncbi:hypothetical protein GW17_00055672 [Ensete ventricosum]|nr:hypothetical protein GW17_00055672 [Ensete ventricosum]